MSPEGPIEAFQVVKEGEGYKLEMSEDALGVDAKTTAYAKKRIAGIDKLLDLMSKQVNKEDKLSAKEQKALWHALKHKWEAELEASIPSGFKAAYEAEESWTKAANMISDGLFKELNMTIGAKLTKYSEIVDSEIVVGSADKGDMDDILAGIGASPTPKEMRALWAHHERKDKKSKNDRGVKENYLALGEEDIRNRKNRNR